MTNAVFKGGVYWVDNAADLKKIFDEDVRLMPWRIPRLWLQHLKTRYHNTPGVVNLQYDVIKPILMVRPKSQTRARNERLPGAELLVVCEQGNISREEAVGKEYMPNEAEVLKRAAAIRKQHMDEGLVRNAGFVGFALQKVVQRPMIATA